MLHHNIQTNNLLSYMNLVNNNLHVQTVEQSNKQAEACLYFCWNLYDFGHFRKKYHLKLELLLFRMETEHVLKFLFSLYFSINSSFFLNLQLITNFLKNSFFIRVMLNFDCVKHMFFIQIQKNYMGLANWFIQLFIVKINVFMVFREFMVQIQE